MDKYEFKLKTDQISALVENKDYKQAAKIADGIDWRRVRNVDLLTKVSEAYEKTERYEDAYEVLNIAYERAPIGRMIVFRMAEIATLMGDYKEAENLYKDFVKIAPHDLTRYILRYEISRAKGAPLEEQIGILEEFKSREYHEKWAYELARLYYKCGLKDKCVEECDDLALWFSEGEYVRKAMELKMQIQPLTPSQREKYLQVAQATGGMPMPDPWATGKTPDGAQIETAGEEPASYTQNAEEMSMAVNSEEPAAETDVPYAQYAPLDMSAVGAQNSESGEEGEKDILSIVAAQIEQSESAAANTQTETPVLHAEFATPFVFKQTKAQNSEQPPARPKRLSDTDEEEIASDVYQVGGEEIKIRSVNPADKYSTMNLQEELAGQLQSLLDSSEEESRAEELEKTKRFEFDYTQLAQETGRIVAQLKEDAKQDLAFESHAAAETEAAQIAARKHIHIGESADGQLTFNDAENVLDRQITGQVTITDILAEWEAQKKVMEGRLVELEKEEEEKREARRKAREEEEARKAAEEEKARQEELAAQQMQRVTATTIGTDQLIQELEARLGVKVVLHTPKQEELLRGAIDIEEILTAPIISDGEKPDDTPVVIAAEEAPAEEAEVIEAEETPAEAPENIAEEETPAQEPEEIEAEEAPAQEPEKIEAEEASAEEPELSVDRDELSQLEAMIEEMLNADLKETEDDLPVDIDAAEAEEPEKIAVEEAPAEETEEIEAEETPAEESEEIPAAEEIPVTEELDEDFQTRRITVSETTNDDKSTTMWNLEHVLAEELKYTSGSEKAVLSKEQQQLFAYFTSVRGMNQQIGEFLSDEKKRRLDGSSRTGNVVVVGESGNGKTTLAIDLVKALQKQRGQSGSRMAKINAEDLNRKDIAEVVRKISGGALVIEQAGSLNSKTAAALSSLMIKETGNLFIVLEDEEEEIRKLFQRCESLGAKFSRQIVIPAFNNNELVAFGRSYAEEQGYTLDDMAVLALFNHIGYMQTSDHLVNITEVKEIVDQAIIKSEGKGISKMFSRRRKDDNGNIILLEKDFEE